MNESCHTCSEAKKRMDWYAEVKPASLVRYVYTPVVCSVLPCVAVCEYGAEVNPASLVKYV